MTFYEETLILCNRYISVMIVFQLKEFQQRRTPGNSPVPKPSPSHSLEKGSNDLPFGSPFQSPYINKVCTNINFLIIYDIIMSTIIRKSVAFLNEYSF